LQALQVVEFLAKRGSTCCVPAAQQLTPLIEQLQNFTHRSKDGTDTGSNVRIRCVTARHVVCRAGKVCQVPHYPGHAFVYFILHAYIRVR